MIVVVLIRKWENMLFSHEENTFPNSRAGLTWENYL